MYFGNVVGIENGIPFTLLEEVSIENDDAPIPLRTVLHSIQNKTNLRKLTVDQRLMQISITDDEYDLWKNNDEGWHELYLNCYKFRSEQIIDLLQEHQGLSKLSFRTIDDETKMQIMNSLDTGEWEITTYPNSTRIDLEEP